jgi:hypothetical protein
VTTVMVNAATVVGKAVVVISWSANLFEGGPALLKSSAAYGLMRPC